MPFYICTKFEINILSLTVIVFTRNGLHTCIHTHIHTYIHTYTQTFLFDIWVQHVPKRISVQKFFLQWILKIFVRLQYTYLIKSNRYNNMLFTKRNHFILVENYLALRASTGIKFSNLFFKFLLHTWGHIFVKKNVIYCYEFYRQCQCRSFICALYFLKTLITDS